MFISPLFFLSSTSATKEPQCVRCLMFSLTGCLQLSANGPFLPSGISLNATVKTRSWLLPWTVVVLRTTVHSGSWVLWWRSEMEACSLNLQERTLENLRMTALWEEVLKRQTGAYLEMNRVNVNTLIVLQNLIPKLHLEGKSPVITAQIDNRAANRLWKMCDEFAISLIPAFMPAWGLRYSCTNGP